MESFTKVLINEFLVEYFHYKQPNFNKLFPRTMQFLVYSWSNSLVNLMSISLKEKGVQKKYKVSK